jgi:hypothetical protein
MKQITIGHHTGSRCAFMDMSGRFKPKVWGGTFRMGDRAAAHLWVAEWRKRNPNDRIIVIDDPFKGDAVDALNLDAVWLFSGVADQVWMMDRKDEHIERPKAYPLYHTNLWRIWLWLRSNRTVDPVIKPKPESMERARQLLKDCKVPAKFMTVQPLFDAGYNKGRNAPIPWWRAVTEQLKLKYPVVMLGSHTVAQQFQPMAGVYPLWEHRLSPMDSLAVLSMSAAHLGGETGLTLWSAMFRRPTLAAYSRWGTTTSHFPMDCRPIPMGAPVEHVPLGGDAKHVLAKAEKMLC